MKILNVLFLFFLLLFFSFFQVQSKKLKKYEKEYVAMKEAQMQQEDPIDRFEVTLLIQVKLVLVHSCMCE